VIDIVMLWDGPGRVYDESMSLDLDPRSSLLPTKDYGIAGEFLP